MQSGSIITRMHSFAQCWAQRQFSRCIVLNLKIKKLKIKQSPCTEKGTDSHQQLAIVCVCVYVCVQRSVIQVGTCAIHYDCFSRLSLPAGGRQTSGQVNLEPRHHVHEWEK